MLVSRNDSVAPTLGHRSHDRSHVRGILAKMNVEETSDDHRRVPAVITFLEAN